MYNPNNIYVYVAAYSGALSGMGASPLGSQQGSIVKADYTAQTEAAGAFAQEFDTQWGEATTTLLDEELIWSCCSQAIANRTPLAGNASDNNPLAWTAIAQSIISLIQEGDIFVSGQGISPPSGDGGITGVSATAPLHVSGGDTPDFTISPATELLPGSMSAADKTKLDGLTQGITGISVTAPLQTSGGPDPDLYISPATELLPGSMSAADKVKLDGLGEGAFNFSPVSLIKAILAIGGISDQAIETGGSLTAGVSFVIYDTSIQHYCTGVRLLWPGEATTLEAQLWSVKLGASFLVGTLEFAAPAGGTNLVPLDLTGSFGAPIPLVPGQFYVIAYSDVGSSPQFWQLDNNGFTIFGAVTKLISIASDYHIYAVYPSGTGQVSPFALYAGSANAFPSLPSNFQMMEPVLV